MGRFHVDRDVFVRVDENVHEGEGAVRRGVFDAVLVFVYCNT